MTQADEQARPPLDGVLVLDLSRVLAGPLAGQSLGDLGATVIKVENPDGGDDTRRWGPPFRDGESGYYMAFNRNKRSVAINLKHPDGIGLVRDLARRADILIENYRLGTLEALGLGPEALMAENPGLIYASISGYGRTGPRAGEAGYDFVIQGESGLMSITGEIDGEPQKLGLPISDIITGLTLTQSILAALHARARDGRGQHIDMALLEAQMAVLGNVGMNVLITGEEAPRTGNAHPNIVPYQVFAASDGAFILACGNDRQFRALCASVLESPDLAADPRFIGNDNRVRNREVLVGLLAALFAPEPAGLWVERMRAVGIPCGRVRGVMEALAAPEARARGMTAKSVLPDGGDGPPVIRPAHRLSRTPIQERPLAPPRLGADTDAVLSRYCGLAEEDLRRLRAAGALG